MSDPRLNDPRLDDTRSDPVLQGSAGSGSTWAWVGGIAAVVLIAILALGNWHTGTDTGTPVTANNPPMSSPAGSAGTPPVRNVTPPTTTGSGATAPTPPAQPAPQPNPQ